MEEIEVINPKRRRRRRMTAKQRRYFGKRGTRRRARRNPPAMSANPRRGGRRRVRRFYQIRSRRFVRRNPAGNIINSAMYVLKDGAVGVAGIAVNNAVGNTACDLLKVTDPTLKQGVKVLTAVLLPTLVGVVLPGYKRQAAVGGAAALACIGAQMLEQKVYPMMGPTVSKLLSSNGYGGGATSQATPPGTNDPPKVGYLPGTPRGYVGYLPAVANYVGGNGMPTAAMVNHF